MKLQNKFIENILFYFFLLALNFGFSCGELKQKPYEEQNITHSLSAYVHFLPATFVYSIVSL